MDAEQRFAHLENDRKRTGLNSKVRILSEDLDQKSVCDLPLCFLEPTQSHLNCFPAPTDVGS